MDTVRYRRNSAWVVLLAFGLVLVFTAIVLVLALSPPAAAGSAVQGPAPVPLGSATPRPTPCDGEYTYTTSTGVIVPGTNLVPGSQCGGCSIGITLPFGFEFYGQTYTTANLTTQGNMQFVTSYMPTPVSSFCPLPNPQLGPAILPHAESFMGTGWHTSCQENIGSPCGIYTSTTGIAPNRIFNIEWRTQFVSTSQHTAQFEVRLHEGTNEINFEYGWISYSGSNAAIGLQDGGTHFTTYACDVSGSAHAGLEITWSPPCRAPTHTPSPTPTAPPGCTPYWSVVQSPADSYSSSLYSVDAVAPNNIWAVGRASHPAVDSVYILHWDGTQWNVAATPQAPPGSFPALRGVSALSANDIWAVGYTTAFDDPHHQYTLTLHWNGSAWSVVSSPNPGGSGWNYLAAVKAISPSDVWAVGYFGDPGAGGDYRALFLHWNGSAWSVVQGTDPAGAGRRLFGMDALASNDAWAAGVNDSRSAMFHWTGLTWSDVPVPDIGQVRGISALAANDIWAVGEGGTLHWDGAAWSMLASPVLPLYGVHAVAANDVWAVGAGRELAHWNGAAWRRVANPVVGVLYAVTSAAPGELWAVGQQYNTFSTGQTLTERSYGTCTTGTPTSTPVNTRTITATATYTASPSGTAASSTPTATGTRSPSATAAATPCAISFTDVQPSDYFYEPVRYLYCMGAISGYADNTFRPYNSTTRGQLSKIVVLAEGIPINAAGGPHFTDVPASNPFYSFVETAYNAGLVSGYVDGTFRWGNDITRGQLCKIVVSAEGWSINTNGGPHFSDVPTNNPFYVYIETAYNHGIISGYADGTFRPGASATRGQIAKIVYSALQSP